MPYDDPDPTDPMTLHGVGLETADDSAMIDMAECFIDEYARLGFDANRILHMFNTKGYAGPFMATQALGEEQIRLLVDRVMARWGGRRNANLVLREERREISLSVLNG